MAAHLEAWREGRDMAKLGVPEVANPYQRAIDVAADANQHTEAIWHEHARNWSSGWASVGLPLAPWDGSPIIKTDAFGNNILSQ